MSAAYSLDVGELHTLSCGVEGCGIAFAIPSDMHSSRSADGKYFYCPNGHRIHFSESDNARLTRELEQTKKQFEKKLEWKQQEVARADERAAAARRERDANEKRRRSQKAATTKLRKRACAGLCPLCAKSMPDLAAHVAEAHPADEQTKEREC